MDDFPTNKKKIFQIWNRERNEKKSFASFPTINEVIKKGNFFFYFLNLNLIIFFFEFLANEIGLAGQNLVLEENGTEIEDDEVLEFFNDQKHIFILLNNEKWIPPNFAEREISTVLPSGRSISPSTSESPSTSISISQSSFDSNTLFSDFEIPWHKMSPAVQTLLTNKKILGKELNSFANVIVDEMRKYSTQISMKEFRIIANDIAKQKPDSFLEKDTNGMCITTTPVALTEVLRNRNNTLNRSPKIERTDNVHIKYRKRMKVFKETCNNWESEYSDGSESLSSMEEKKHYMQKISAEKFISSEDRQKIKAFMKDCFKLQRLFLNDLTNIPQIDNIITEWPYIIDDEILASHFEQLMKVHEEKFSLKFIETKIKLLKFFKIEDNGYQDIIKHISNHFNENVEYLFKYFEVCILVITVLLLYTIFFFFIVRYNIRNNSNIYSNKFAMDGNYW